MASRGYASRAGEPLALGSEGAAKVVQRFRSHHGIKHLWVLKRKLKVTKNMPLAPRLARPETRGNRRRVKIPRARMISMTPMIADAVLTSKTASIQASSGE